MVVPPLFVLALSSGRGVGVEFGFECGVVSTSLMARIPSVFAVDTVSFVVSSVTAFFAFVTSVSTAAFAAFFSSSVNWLLPSIAFFFSVLPDQLKIFLATKSLVGLMPGCRRIILFLLLLYHSFKSNFARFDGSIYLFGKESFSSEES